MLSRSLEIAGAAGLGAAAVCATWAHATFNARCQWFGRLVWRGRDGSAPQVALTFDDGPWPGATDRMLDILGEMDVRAAFFVIGKYVDRHPRLACRIEQEGHLLGNHTYDHLGLAFVRGRRFWGEQIDRCDAAIERACGVWPRLYRPPLGMKTWISAEVAGREHIAVTWSRSARDGLSTTPDRILSRLRECRGGDIVLLHDGVSPQSRRDPLATVRALPQIIRELRARGIEPVRLDAITGLAPYAKPEGAKAGRS